MAYLFIDMDGTLCEWKQASTNEDLYVPGYFRDLKPHRYVLNAIKILMRCGIDVHILTSCLADHPSAEEEKRQWLQEHLPQLDQSKVYVCEAGASKAEFFERNVGPMSTECILLDDYTLNLDDWTQHGGTGIKLMNGVNGTGGTWRGYTVSRFDRPEELASQLMHIFFKEGEHLYD